jgi:hypothetical protein
MELQLQPDRYDGSSAIGYVEAAHLRREEGRACIQAPLGDAEEFAIYFAGGSPEIDEALLASARSLLRAIGRLDNTIQKSWVAQCRESGLHPRNFEGELAYVEVSASAATLHYFGSRVNTEWDEEVEYRNGRWEYPSTTGQ